MLASILLAIAPALSLPTQAEKPESPPAETPPPESEASADRLVGTLPDKYAFSRMAEKPNGPAELEYLPFAFSPDGSRVAFLAAKKDRIYAFLDGKELGFGHKGQGPVFSANGKHAIMALGKVNNNRSEKWTIYVDGSKAGNEDWVGPLSISPDGKSIAYWTKPNYRMGSADKPVKNRNVMVVGKRKSKKFRQAKSKSYSWASTWDAPLFNEDFSRALGSAYNEVNEGIIISVGGRKEEILRASVGFYSQTVYSKDAKHAATVRYIVNRDVKGRGKFDPEAHRPRQLEVDGKLIEANADSIALPRFSSNGEHCSFVFVRDKHFGIGIDGELLPVSEHMILSAMPDASGAHIAWVEHRGGDLAEKLWLNKSVDKSIYQGQAHLCSAYVVDGEDGGLALADQEESDPYDRIYYMTFSPNEELVAFVGATKEGYYIVCGAQRIGPFEEVGEIRWLDEKTVGVGTREHRDYWWRTLRTKD